MNPYDPPKRTTPSRNIRLPFVQWLNPLERLIALMTALAFVVMLLFVVVMFLLSLF